MSYISQNHIISAFAAKTHLSQLLQKVQEGESFMITKHNHPIALLLPIIPKKSQQDIKEVIHQIKENRQNMNLRLSEIKKWKEEGRR